MTIRADTKNPNEGVIHTIGHRYREYFLQTYNPMKIPSIFPSPDQRKVVMKWEEVD